MTASSFYTGIVSHARLRPRYHKLQYKLFNLLLDLDELPTLGRRLRLFGFDRAALFSFHQRDHGAGTETGLRAWVEQHLQEAGVNAGGAIRLLCMPRILGHAFNPLSVYFCHHPDGGVAAIIYQVNNTFGQRHSYLIPVNRADSPGLVLQDCAKVFYVSPFMDMDLRYRFVIQPPADHVGVTINVLDKDGAVAHGVIPGRAVRLDGPRFVGRLSTDAHAGVKGRRRHPLGSIENLAQRRGLPVPATRSRPRRHYRN